ncbi:MAG TPA: hypothetical protein VFL91_18935 [Thermomicrobiales bacterium]|nr:hypothetical protein [Thermomicrobiales bacterium]
MTTDDYAAAMLEECALRDRMEAAWERREAAFVAFAAAETDHREAEAALLKAQERRLALDYARDAPRRERGREWFEARAGLAE